MKLAVQYFAELPEPQKNRTKFIARGQSYHGATLGALALGGHWARRELYKALLMDNVHHISPCNPYHDRGEDETEGDYLARLVKELEDKFIELGPKNVIAFVAEPVVGAVCIFHSIPLNSGNTLWEVTLLSSVLSCIVNVVQASQARQSWSTETF